MKIVFTEKDTVTNGDISLDIFEDFGDVTYYPLTNAAEMTERGKDAEVIICNKTPMNAETLANAKNLKYIGVLATGYNNIDMDYINSRGITVCNAGSYSTDAVAQHVFAMILNHASPVAAYDAYVQKGEWQKTPIFSPFVFPAMELSDKTLGIIGYGSIGQAVAKIALAFGMKVLVFNRSVKEDPAVTFCDFDTLLENADIVTVHCPLNDASQHMFSKTTFEKMKDGAYFINTARGGVVVEEDLVAVLNSGKLRGAAVDVIAKEPMPQDSPLVQVPHLIITPHVAWTPLETRKRLIAITLDNLDSYLKGTPKNIVSQK